MQSNYSAFKIFSLIHLTMTSPKNKQPSNFTRLISVISQISEQILFAYYSIIITVQINKLITLKFRFCIQNDGHVTPLNPFLFSVSFDQFYFLFFGKLGKKPLTIGLSNANLYANSNATVVLQTKFIGSMLKTNGKSIETFQWDRQDRLTFNRYELIQLVNVFFCTRSCSSENVRKDEEKVNVSKWGIHFVHLQLIVKQVAAVKRKKRLKRRKKET